MSVKILCFRPWCEDQNASLENISDDDFRACRLRIWKDSDIRKWLNTVFLNEAFTADEQRYMPEMLMTEYGNYDYQKKTRTIRDSCRDRVFLPWYHDGISDALYYDESHRISSDMVLNPEITPYALIAGPGKPELPYQDSISWWSLDRRNRCHWHFWHSVTDCMGIRPFILVEL